MMKFLSAIAILFTAILHSQSIAQTKQYKLLLGVYPPNAVVRIDTQLVQMKSNGSLTLLLDSGKHEIKMWAPTHKLIIDTLKITNRPYNIYNKKLPHTTEYLAYKKQLKSYRFIKTVKYTTEIAGPVILLVNQINWQRQRVEYKDRLETYKNSALSNKYNYDSALGTDLLDQRKANFNQAKADYNEYLKKYNSSIVKSAIVGAVMTTGLTLVFIAKIKRAKPTYSETPLLSYHLSTNPNALFSIQLSL